MEAWKSGDIRRVVAVVLTSVALMAVYPPWVHTYQEPGMARATRAVGYSALWAPPPTEYDSPTFGVQVDVQRFLIQVVGLLALGAALFLFAGGRSPLSGAQSPDELALDKEINRLFVVLWTRGTHQPGYDKNDTAWDEMRGLLVRKGVRM